LAAKDVALDWSDPTALLHAAMWLEEKGHPAAWMLPFGILGGTVPAHAGMTAHEVSAIILARSVRRVAGGLGSVRALLPKWTGTGGKFYRGAYYANVGSRCYVCFDHWSYAGGSDYKLTGPEIGEAGRNAADDAALSDGCALLTPTGLLLPPLPESR
jgi:hypothetical protein